MGMIKKINNVKDFGIFESIADNPAYKDFNRFNLVYGLNGSGKSTLSYLFSLVEIPTNEKRFPVGKWNFQLSDGTALTEATSESNLNIRVFDKGFVENNINWNDIIKGILVVSETKKEEITKRDKKRIDLNAVNESIKNLEIELNGEEKKKGKKGIIKANSNFLTEAAKSIKEKFQLIDVKDTHLSNYNKTKLETALNESKSLIQKKQLSTSEVEKLSDSVKPQDKNQVDIIDLINIKQLEDAYEQIKSVLNLTVTSIILNDLKDSPEKSEWAKIGLELHSKNETCSFCGNKVTKERIDELNNHFSDSFNRLIESIEKQINWIDNYKFPEIPNKVILYKEYQKDYSKLSEEILLKIRHVQSIMGEWKTLLENKKNNPFSENREQVPISKKTKLDGLYHWKCYIRLDSELRYSC